ncbi:MAG: hypothetical protein AABY22_24535, partial [Nanoarchaeota archaeon]
FDYSYSQYKNQISSIYEKLAKQGHLKPNPGKGESNYYLHQIDELDKFIQQTKDKGLSNAPFPKLGAIKTKIKELGLYPTKGIEQPDLSEYLEQHNDIKSSSVKGSIEQGNKTSQFVKKLVNKGYLAIDSYKVKNYINEKFGTGITHNQIFQHIADLGEAYTTPKLEEKIYGKKLINPSSGLVGTSGKKYDIPKVAKTSLQPKLFNFLEKASVEGRRGQQSITNNDLLYKLQAKEPLPVFSSDKHTKLTKNRFVNRKPPLNLVSTTIPGVEHDSYEASMSAFNSVTKVGSLTIPENTRQAANLSTALENSILTGNVDFHRKGFERNKLDD